MHSPPSKSYEMFNRNTIQASYNCTRSTKKITKKHICNTNTSCLLEENYQVENLIYKSKITWNLSDYIENFYLELAYKHFKSFNCQGYKKDMQYQENADELKAQSFSL